MIRQRVSTASGKNWRLVSEQGDERHVSGAPLTRAEAAEMLDAEEMLHRAAGWRVLREGGRVVCERPGVLRIVSAEEVGQ